MKSPNVPRPLAGLKVVELARILAGPWCGQILADLGAEVVKIEHPQGDDTRRWGPPFVKHINGGFDAAYFHCCNRGKQSIAVDFNDKSEREALHQILKDADVLIENFKVGSLKKFGLDYETLSKKYPALVYCSITGFGQDGPYAKRNGYDFIVQGYSGIMDITGEANGPPQKIGVALADIISGLYATIGIQSALIDRLTSKRGSHIDIALLDSMVGVLANQAQNYLSTGIAPSRMGNSHPNIAPYQSFQVIDGHVIIAVGNDQQFKRLCQALKIGSMSNDERFASNELRVANREDLAEFIQTECLKFTVDELLQCCIDYQVPASPINTIQDVFHDPQVVARELKIPLENGQEAIRTPIKINGQGVYSDKPAPTLDSASHFKKLT